MNTIRVRVPQTRFGQEGNCIQACLASFFGLPIEEALHPEDENNWLAEVQEWCLPRGYLAICIQPKVPLKPAGIHFMGGISARGLGHLVVAQDGEMIHDPHPNGDGLTEHEDWILMIPLVHKGEPR